jgi:hypothetical protein
MILNLQNDKDVIKLKDKVEYFINKGKTIDITEKRNTRTTKQNSALHLFFTIITNQLNEMGLEYNYIGLKGQIIGTRYNTNIVKEFLWRPIQKTLFDIHSTKEINTIQINEIIDVLSKWFGEKGVYIEFPNIEQLIKKQ